MATLTGKIEWEPWAAKAQATTEERRDQWAREIAAGEISQTLGGDSMVFADFDADNAALTIYDALIRRTATVPLPGGAEGWRLRDAAADLADALKDAEETARCGCTIHEIESGHLTDCWLPGWREKAHAALKKAGRLQ